MENWRDILVCAGRAVEKAGRQAPIELAALQVDRQVGFDPNIRAKAKALILSKGE